MPCQDYLKSRIEKTIFCLLLLFVYIYFFQTPAGFNNPNEYSRMYLTTALVDHGVTSIDAPIEKYGFTEDRSSYEGKTYTSKAPGLSFLGVPVYFLQKSAAELMSVSLSHRAILYALRIFCVSLPSSLFCLYLYLFFQKFAPDRGRPLALVLGYGLGTLAFTYSTLFYGHQLSAILCFAAFAVLFQGKEKGMSPSRLFCAGLLSGYAMITEFPTGLIIVFLTVYLFTILDNKKRVAIFFLGMLPAFVLMMAYNYSSFGSPFDIGYQHEAEKVYIETSSQGFMGITYPSISSLYEILVGPYRGLFFFSPFLVLFFPSLYYFHRDQSFRKEFWLIVAIFAGYVYVASGYAVWHGGWCVGPRHLTPVIPFMLTPMLFLPTRKTVSALATILICLSVLLAFLCTIIFPYFPNEFKNPLFEAVLPIFFGGQTGANIGNTLGLYGLWSLIPLFAICTVGTYYLFKGEIFLYASLLGILLALLFGLHHLVPKKDLRDLTARAKIYALIGSPHFESAAALANDGQGDLAIKELHESLKFNPNLANAHMGLGVLYSQKGELEPAAAQFKQVLVLLPNSGQAHLNLSVIYLKEGERSLARFHAQQAQRLGLNVDPEFLKELGE